MIQQFLKILCLLTVEAMHKCYMGRLGGNYVEVFLHDLPSASVAVTILVHIVNMVTKLDVRLAHIAGILDAPNVHIFSL